jgi:hypothetical protein
VSKTDVDFDPNVDSRFDVSPFVHFVPEPSGSLAIAICALWIFRLTSRTFVSVGGTTRSFTEVRSKISVDSPPLAGHYQVDLRFQ